jgi:DNA-binding transcriptional MerR regulator
VEKGPDAFRTISEVAEDLDLPQHVLRFWETRFGQIKPLKRGGGRRYYRPEDIDLLRGIRHLLYGEGYTIRGVQQILREQGVRHVQAIGQSAAEEAARTASVSPARERGGVSGLMDLLPSLRGGPKTPELPRVVEVPVPEAEPRSAGTDDPLPQFLRKPQIARPPAEAREDAPAPSPLQDVQPSAVTSLTPEAVQLLQATLDELGECRRILDAAYAREG